MPDDSSPIVGEFIGSLGGTNRARRTTVQINAREASVDLPLNVPYGEPIPEITKTVRNTVVDRVENQSGIEVIEVNITFRDISIPER